jgi:hypothetical protein
LIAVKPKRTGGVAALTKINAAEKAHRKALHQARADCQGWRVVGIVSRASSRDDLDIPLSECRADFTAT